MKFIPVLMENYKAVEQYASNNGLSWFLHKFGPYDVSKTRKHLFPILRILKKTGTTYNDLRANRFVEAFDWYCKNEGVKFKQDTYQFKTIEEFINFTANQRFKLSKKDQKAVTTSQMEKIFENDKALVVRIKGKMASCIYGYGTKWCVTMKNERYYESYVMKGYIFYFVLSKILPPSDLMYKAAMAIDIDRHMHVFNTADTEISNVDGAIDSFLEKHDIPTDIFKYVKTTYMDRLTLSGVLQISGDVMTVTDPNAVDWTKIDRTNYKLKYKDCEVRIDEFTNFNEFPNTLYENCSFTVRSLDMNKLPAGMVDLVTNKTGKSNSLNIDYCTNVNINGVHINDLNISNCLETTILNNVSTKFTAIGGGTINVTNLSATTEFHISGNTSGFIDGLNLNGVQQLSINGEVGGDSLKITNVKIQPKPMKSARFYNMKQLPMDLIAEIPSCEYMAFSRCSSPVPVRFNPRSTVTSIEITSGRYDSIETLPITDLLTVDAAVFANYEWLKTIGNVKKISLFPNETLPIMILRKDVDIQYSYDTAFKDISVDGEIEKVKKLIISCANDNDIFERINNIKHIDSLTLMFEDVTEPLKLTPLTTAVGSLIIESLKIDLNEPVFSGVGLKTINLSFSKFIPNFTNIKSEPHIKLNEVNSKQILSDCLPSEINYFNSRYSTVKALGKFKCKSVELVGSHTLDPLTPENILMIDDIGDVYMDSFTAAGTRIPITKFKEILEEYRDRDKPKEQPRIDMDDFNDAYSISYKDDDDDDDDDDDKFDPYEDDGDRYRPRRRN